MMANKRLNFFLLIFFLFALLVIFRLFYWQVMAGDKLAVLAEKQRRQVLEIPAQRGSIFSADSFPLVTNQEAYLLYANLPWLSETPEKTAAQLAPILSATPSSEIKMKERLSRPDLVWVPLKHKVRKEAKEKIENLNIKGLGFEPENLRFYPEASIAAHLLGFVGSDASGHPQGYFGLEGFYDRELRGQPGLLYQEKDVLGQPILVGQFKKREPVNGHSLVLFLNRTIQYLVEEELKEGMKKYGAKSGSVVIIDPQSGGILAMASRPSYEPIKFSRFEEEVFKNPVVAEDFEPGSIFKIVTMAAALEEGVITPETECGDCDGPVKIGPHLIHTWNDEYFPQSTMTEILEHSDNVGAVFVARQLGEEKFVQYLKKFGLGEKTGVDLQEEASPRLREKWREIDLATAAFGQGIALTPIQMVRVVAAVANGGELVVPRVVKKVIGEREMEIDRQVTGRVISQKTAETLTKMLVSAVAKGEARWCKPEGFEIAGKTGTAQIPIAGHYDEEKTIASFVGFAPPENPRFVMLVTLREPTTSPWASETAAPLWMKIAQKLFLYWGISPQK